MSTPAGRFPGGETRVSRRACPPPEEKSPGTGNHSRRGSHPSKRKSTSRKGCPPPEGKSTLRRGSHPQKAEVAPEGNVDLPKGIHLPGTDVHLRKNRRESPPPEGEVHLPQ